MVTEFDPLLTVRKLKIVECAPRFIIDIKYANLSILMKH